jgi:hypothetical protein
MVKKNVECEIRRGEVWIKLPDLRNVIDLGAIETIEKESVEDDQREKYRLEGKRTAFREVSDALTKYEFQMKNRQDEIY